MLLVKIAYRNLYRQKRRTLFTAAGMILGYVLISFSTSLTAGTYDQIISGYTGAHTGHIQIHFSDYLDVPSIYKVIKQPSKVEDALQAQESVSSFAPRVYSGALSYYENRSTGVILKGIDPSLEEATTNFSEMIIKGEGFSNRTERNIIITTGIEKTLRIKIGSELIFISQGADGSIANDSYKVVGVIDAEEYGVDPNLIMIPIGTLQEFISLGESVHEYAIALKDFKGAYEESIALKRLKELKPLSVDPWQVVIKDFYRAMEADKKGNVVTLGIIVLVVSIGILNTILMSVLERTREFGVLKALGTPPFSIFSLIVIENAIIAFLSLAVGFLIAFGLISYYSVHEILLAEPFNYGGLKFSGMKTTLSVSSFLLPMAVILLSTFLVSLWPGIRAAKILPVEAMRS